MKKAKESAFYCYKKMCRKTAWDTPEYLSEEDWVFLKRVYDIIIQRDVDAFLWLFHDNQMMWNALFNRMLGWPEGASYCRKYDFVAKSFMPENREYGVGSKLLKDIEGALSAHHQTKANTKENTK